MSRSPILIRPACAFDVPWLAQIKPTRALHRDRLADATGTDVHYLVAEWESELVGFALLVLEPPAHWLPLRHAPQLLDANVDALRLYRRLGYEPIDATPIEEHWSFTDSEGTRHEGIECLVYLRCALDPL